MTAKNKTLYGHEAAEKAWLSAFNENKLHHAHLICGDKGIGKASFAHKIAEFMLSNPDKLRSSLDIDPKSPTALKVQNKSHPDFFILESEKEEDGAFIKTDIKVDDIRKLTHFLSFTSIHSKHKIAIIDAVDDLNINAANALLKFLEEPFANTYFLLVCNSLGNILPTIRSRCRLLPLRKLSREDFSKALNKISNLTTDQIENLYLLTNGSLYYSNLLLKTDSGKLLKEIENIFVSDAKLEKLISLAKNSSSDSHFEIFKYVILNLMHNKIKSLAVNNISVENYIDKYDKIASLIQVGDNLNLDRNYVTLDVIHHIQN